MTRHILSTYCLVMFGLMAGSAPALSLAQRSSKPEEMVRFVWQDREQKTLQWGELVKIGAPLVFQKGDKVERFPQLDQDRHELVQMERIDNLLLVGVRDDDRGQFLSGWVAVDLGVTEHPHGDHSDFTYARPPRVIASVLDQAQGNPAHLYVYDKTFYLANDSLNGYTKISPRALKGPESGRKGTFHRGGGGHITLAAVGNRVGYATWIAPTDNKGGLIDVSDLSKTGEQSLAYSFELPVAGLHGATANSGRVFFAPSDGLYWVNADLNLRQTAASVQPNHLSLGTDPDSERPLRTGSFTNHRNLVLCTTGRGPSSALCLIDASARTPSVLKISLDVADGLAPASLETVITAAGKHYAFVFQNKLEGDAEEKLTIVDLDPNRDRNFHDAQVVKTLTVGPSLVDGHYGHHTICFDGDARFALLTNPGSGEIWLLSLTKLEILDKYKVGGIPTKILAIGGEASKH